MIIVLFHALFLFGKYVYESFHKLEKKSEDTMISNRSLNVTEADYRDCNDAEYSTKNVNVKFFPPVYVQRYTTVQSILASSEYYGKIHKVIDFGCAELGFAIHLKNTNGIKEIYCIDVDRSLLENYQTKVAPLYCDYLSLRTEPLTIHVCEGSIAHNDNKLANSDAVICIELIEHLYPDDLEAFPYNVFGFIKPQVAIITTPNADFNVLFNLNGFRHTDHKFEWTRAEFQDWANNIVARYPDYEVSFHGIGAGPGGTEHLGFCSQMAVFHRHTQLHDQRVEGVDGLLKTIVSHEYPYRADNRSDEEKILAEAEYYIRLFSSRDEELSEELPLSKLMFSVEKFRISVEILRSILEEANWAIADRENGAVVLIPPQSSFSSNFNTDFDDFLENDHHQHGNDDDWDALEPGAAHADYFFDDYMERDPQHHEEEENWDDEPHDIRYNSSSNLWSENLPNSELHVSENLDLTSDSQWTVNAEDPLLDSLQHQQSGIIIDGSSTETELPSDSFLIGLDSTRINYSNITEHILSSPLPLANETKTPNSLGIDSGHSSFINRNHILANNNIEEASQKGETNTDTEVNMHTDAISKFLELSDNQNPVQCDDNHLTPDNEEPDIKFLPCTHVLGTENHIEKCDMQVNLHLPPNDHTTSLSGESPALYLESAATRNVDFHSTHNETSSISTVKATSLLSHEQSLLLDNQELQLNAQTLSENKDIFVNDRKNLKQSINSVAEDGSDTDVWYLGDEVLCQSINNLSSATNKSIENIGDLGESIDSSYPQCEIKLINAQRIESEGIKSQDSMSFKSSISQIEQNPDIKDTVYEETYQSHPKTTTSETLEVQSLGPKMNLFHSIGDNRSSSEGKQIAISNSLQSKTVVNISPSPSQLSLQSNSDINLSTATSTGSSDVDKWYDTETNPMYQQDFVVLKGGNALADNPKEEITSDSDVMISGSDKGKDSETAEVIHCRSEASDHCHKPQNDLKKHTTNDLDKTELGPTDKKVNIIQDWSKNVDDVELHQFFPEPVENSQRLASFLLTVQKTDDNVHHLPLNRPDLSNDLEPPCFSKQIGNENLNFNNFGTRITERNQLQSTITKCKSTSSNEVSTSYDISKIAKERSHLRCEFESARGLENFESKPFSPELLDTPPDSWSPEVMDSGYPNSTSVHDITPEYELSSITNDRISDSDSASIGEAPAAGFYEFVEVENGDLANNNRDDEGNNVVAFEADDLDDLQPLIDVLENDMENENDIYVLQNGFPLWLLRILQMANPRDLEGMGGQQVQQYPALLGQAGGDAPNIYVYNDEGFDSTSSDDDIDIENDEVDDATTVSSEDTEDHSAENLRRDWRAGGDP